MLELPEIIEVADLAPIMRWTTRRTRDWLAKTKSIEKRGGRWVTTPARLQSNFPEAFEALLAHYTRKSASEQPIAPSFDDEDDLESLAENLPEEFRHLLGMSG